MMLSRRYLIATIALAWMLAASACGGTDTRDEEPGEWTPCMCPEKNPRLRAPERIAFANVRAGGAVDEVVELRNEGDEILEIAEIGVSEGDEDELREFRPADDWPAQTQIAAGESIELGITYAPKNGETDTGHLWLETNDPREEKQHAEISLQAQDMSPRLVVSSEVVFSAVKPGSESSQRLTVQNQGQSALQLDKIRRTGSNTFGVRRSDGAPVSTVEGAVLQPGDSVDLQVSFVPEDDAPEYGELILHTDDSERPQTTVQLSGNTGTPCLAVSPSERLRFGTHAVATPATETVSLGNCRPNEADLTIRRIEMTDDGGGVFEIDRESIPGALADGEEYVVEGDEQVDFQVDYEPGSKRLHRGELTVVTDDPARRHHEIELVGRGTSDESCPEAVARASVTGRDRQGTDIETLPRETIQFDGTASSDWDGTVERYEWSIVERPQGSTARLKPSSRVPKPELFLDRAGTYRVELTVYDEFGNASGCRGKQATVEIRACPCNDLHVQLVWETPRDSDPTDGEGTNLDLHYLHPNGEWNAAPYDIHADIRTADWGQPGDSSDDPSLDVDDTDGGGPENINHNGLEAGKSYAVGVYYRDDDGFGPSYATVRIYRDGQLKREYKNKYLEPGQFWEVALVERPNTLIVTRDEVYDGLPEGG